MGLMEEQSKQRARKINLQKQILGVVSAVGIVGVALVTPNVFVSLHKLGLMPTKRHGQSINRARDRLIKKGLLTRKDGFLRVTPRGEATLQMLQLEDYRLRRPRRWDKKWRVLIFDIPEYRRSVRQKLRHTLITIGFERLQDSVWVYPYDCEDLIALLKADFKVGKDILYMIVDELEGDARLKKHFGLYSP